MTNLEDLARTPDLVTDCCAELNRDIPDAFRTQAIEYARRAELEHPINRAPSTMAAAAIYLTGLNRDTRISQEPIADAIGVSEVALRNCYPEIADAEDITLSRAVDHSATEVEQ